VGVLFHTALERPAEQRLQFLREQTDDDPLVIREVESLLSAHADAGEFLDDAGLTAVRLCDAIGTLRLPPGTRVGAFEIVEPLGAGGMGEVYRARDTRLDRAVAIKVLSTRVAADSSAHERFERQARSISRLNHPHICTLYDVGTACVEGEDVEFLVMELLEGETLAARLSQGPLPLGHAVKVALDIADALAAADAHGVVHRDLKPANIMLTKSAVKLLDFGVAHLRLEGRSGRRGRSHDADAVDDAHFGTLPYMAPEQLRGAEADARADLFAFGAVLYEMIAGTRAFDGDSPAALRTAILETDPVPLIVRQPLTPPSLSRLVATCLARDPDERWQHARDVTLALKEINAAISAPHSDWSPLLQTPATPPTSSWRVHLAWAVVVAMLGVALLFRQPAARLAPPPNRQPVVVLMNSPGRAYDAGTQAAGGTNADDISDALRDFPVVTFKENTSSMWHREDEVRKQNPDLIISHLSALLESREAETAVEERLFDAAVRRLTLFFGYIGYDNPRTRFLVYSRSRFATPELEASWIADVVQRFPKLKGRLSTFPMPGGRQNATFRDPATARLLRDRVKAMLGLP
jgi:serine/threonine protein kinase